MRMKNNGICDYKAFESQSIRIQAETKQQRHDRLQITRNNTARRTEVERKEFSDLCCIIIKLHINNELKN